MIWNTSWDSTRIPTKDGSLAVRVDGDPHKDPLLLCQRFRGTMDDWDPERARRKQGEVIAQIRDELVAPTIVREVAYG
jgi:hypothetical protein